MLKRSLFFIVAGVLVAFSETYAVCTPEDVEEKSRAFISEFQALASADNSKYIEAIGIIEQNLPALQDAESLDAICKFYDDWQEKVK